MGQQEFTPKDYHILTTRSSENQAAIHLQRNEHGSIIDFSFEAIRPGIFKTTFLSDVHPLPPFRSALRPEPDITAFRTIASGERSRTIRDGEIEATIDWIDAPLVSVGFAGGKPLYADLPLRSYSFDGPGIAHYTCYHRGSLHIGLGEKPAPMDLSNRHFILSATDCFGYDVHRTDPMYKHIPLLIRATPLGVVATFSTSHARGYYSVGSEMDGLWGHYKVYRQDHGGLEMYILIGRTLQDVVKLYADLVGYPLLVPRWAFGYLAGGMKYSMLDHPRASEALMEFAAKLEKFGIPCSGFQMSSGYTVAETEPKTRNVFTWNRHRFPDPEGFCKAFHAKGIRLIANIKPYILASHPAYDELVESGAFFTSPRTRKSAVARLWSAGGGESGEGGHLDFSSRAAYDFWYEGVKALKATGMDCMWNDNNEYTIPSDDWMLELSAPAIQAAVTSSKEQRRDIGLWGRAMHCELMGKASHDALLEVAPHERPFVLTRSSTAGTMRYACSSWSGDNVTSWAGMRGANALSLTAGMCLLQCYGHDIGGFEGPQPTPELLLRWVQLGVHSPRFAINCFKTLEDNNVGDVIEPWMYPATLPAIRKAIRRRYELLPYLYNLMLQSHLTALPPQRWTGWGYESDSEVWSSQLLKDGETQYWLGDALLIGGVFEPGVTDARMYLPKQTNSDDGFLNTNSPYQYLPAGYWTTIHSPWETSIPVLARIGSVIPVGKLEQTVAPGSARLDNPAILPTDDFRGIEIFPPPEERSDGSKTYIGSWLEDDGVSPAPLKAAKFVVAYVATAKEVAVSFGKEVDAFVPPWLEKGLVVVLPVGDVREVVSGDAWKVLPRRMDELGRRRFCLVPEA